MIKGTVFDMDGLMFDSERITYNGWQKLMDENGYEYSIDVFKQTVGRRKKEVEQFYYSKYGKDFPYRKLSEIQRNNYINFVMTKGAPVKKGLYEILEFLKDNDIKIALATSTSRQTSLINLESAKVEKYFDTLVCGEDVTNGKPDPEVFLTAAKKIGIEPEQCVAFEDSFNGIRSAFAAGMTTVMVPDFIQPTDEILTMVNYLCNDLSNAIEVLKNVI
ncbi:MAG: HAD family phosphatase [Ruminococcus bromii]|nr:HAD family phosphatase [Ruminococcus bromii]MDY4711310.1 HAD family phosphatase [Ruminococcus bromii]